MVYNYTCIYRFTYSTCNWSLRHLISWGIQPRSRAFGVVPWSYYLQTAVLSHRRLLNVAEDWKKFWNYVVECTGMGPADHGRLIMTHESRDLFRPVSFARKHVFIQQSNMIENSIRIYNEAMLKSGAAHNIRNGGIVLKCGRAVTSYPYYGHGWQQRQDNAGFWCILRSTTEKHSTTFCINLQDLECNSFRDKTMFLACIQMRWWTQSDRAFVQKGQKLAPTKLWQTCKNWLAAIK